MPFSLLRSTLILVLLSLFALVPQVLAKELIRGTYYFGSACPISFWSSDLRLASKDFDRIKQDGYNTLFFLVPWGEFQPGLDPIRFNEQAFARLEKLCKLAKEKGFRVFLRVSYTWDMCPEVQEPGRVRFLRLVSSQQLYPVWQAYLERIHDSVGNNCDGVLLCWEDFWMVFSLPNNVTSLQESAKISAQIGFDDYIETNAEAATFKKTYAEVKQRYGAYPLPNPKSTDFRLMYQWFDELLTKKLYPIVNRAFPNQASLEIRMDYDPIFDNENIIEWYSHKATYDVAQSPYVFTYWNPAMGAQNQGELSSAEEVLHRFVYYYNELHKYTQKKIVINQFLFEDNTPGMEHNAKIAPQDLERFFQALPPSLAKMTSGYATWGDRNYRLSILYNSDFALGDYAWNPEGKVTLVQKPDFALQLEQGARISQIIEPTRQFYPSIKHATLKIFAHGSGTLQIGYGTEKYQVEIKDPTTPITLTVPAFLQETRLSIECLSGSVTLTKLSLYQFEYQANIRDVNGNPAKNYPYLIQLNKDLSALEKELAQD